MQIKEIERGSFYFTFKDDELPQVYNPWRRFLARMLDMFIYDLLWSAFIGFAFHVNLASRSTFGGFLDTIIALIMMLFLEPLLLKKFGTTPGKAIFGLRIENPDGSHLSYGQGLERTFEVISSGMGFNIPIYYLYKLWKSYKRCTEKEGQPWDYAISYTMKDTKWYRSALYVGAHAVLIAIIFVIVAAQELPPNRGNLTVAEFVENHNYYSKMLDMDYGNIYLDPDGRWMQENFNGEKYITTINAGMPAFEFTIEDGYIRGISFKGRNDRYGWYVPDNSQMVVASLAFAGAQDEIALFSKIPSRIVDKIRFTEDFHFTEVGITFRYKDTEFSMEK